jgi:type I restriction enzyme S subunit
VVEETQYGTAVKANEEGLGVPVLRMNNLTYSGALDLTDLKYVDLPPKALERCSVQRGDLLFNRTNSQELVGKMAVWDRDEVYAFAGYLVRLRLKRRMADPAFIAAWFNTSEMKKLLRTRAKPSINMANINATEVLKFPVVLPPLADQRRIADFLTRVEALRTKRRAALAQLDALTQAIFLELFGDPTANPKGWQEKTIADLCEVKGGKRLPKGEEYSLTPTPFRYIRVTDLKAGTVEEANLVYLKPEVQAKIARYIVNAGDIIISIAGSIGVIAPVPPSLSGVNLTENAAKLVPRAPNLYNANYLAALLSTPFAQDQINSHIGQVTIGKLALFRIEKLRFPMPPLLLQHDFARRAAAVEKLKATHRASLAELDALFASLQHRAFRGEL